MSSPGIKVVLDTTAILAYPSVNVGELIAEVADEGNLFAVPVVCLAHASMQGIADRVRLLAKHPHCEVLPLLVADGDRLAAWWRLLGRVDCASAMVAARVNRAYLVTADPDAYTDGDDWDLPVIAV